MPRFGYKSYAANIRRGGKFVELATLTEHNRQLRRSWFCEDCEKRFGETSAAQLIRKIESDRLDSQYDEGLLRFVTSFSLRACMFDISVGGPQKQKKKEYLLPAIRQWRSFLLGNAQSVRPFTQHAFVLEAGSAPWDHRMGMEVFYLHNLAITQIGPLVCFTRLKNARCTKHEQWALRQSELLSSGGRLAVLTQSAHNDTLTSAMVDVLDRTMIFHLVMGREFERRKGKKSMLRIL
jgi:hypothetical protein